MREIVDEKYSASSFPIKHTYQTKIAKITLNIPSAEVYSEM